MIPPRQSCPLKSDPTAAGHSGGGRYFIYHPPPGRCVPGAPPRSGHSQPSPLLFTVPGALRDPAGEPGCTVRHPRPRPAMAPVLGRRERRGKAKATTPRRATHMSPERRAAAFRSFPAFSPLVHITWGLRAPAGEPRRTACHGACSTPARAPRRSKGPQKRHCRTIFRS